MLIYLEQYRNRRIARAAAGGCNPAVCAGNSMPEIRTAAPVFAFRTPFQGAGKSVLAHGLDRIYALASRF